MERRYEEEIEIDLMEICMVLLRYLWVILAAAVIVGGAAFTFSRFVVTPTYESTTRILVLNRQEAAGGSLTYSDLQLGTSLTKDYPELIQSRYVVEKVIEMFELDTSYEAFLKKIQVSTKSDSRIIDITLTDPDPALAKEIADALRDIAAQRIVEVTDIQAVNMVDEANLPQDPANPNVVKWTMIGFLLGGFLAAAVVLVRFLLDDTIKSSEDIEKYLHLSTLGLIPLGQAEYDGQTKKKTGKFSQRKSSKSTGAAAADSGGNYPDADDEDIVDLGEED
ncbi:MAG: protein-tyrosine kinase [Acetatifactor sp.]